MYALQAAHLIFSSNPFNAALVSSMNDNVQDTHAAEGSSVSKSDFPSTQTHQAEAIPQAPGKPVDRDHTVISTRPPIYSADSGVFLAPSEIGPTLGSAVGLN